jgi:hypothetical protein
MDSFSIRYRPSAHADPVLATWLNVLAETPDLQSRPVAAAMFKELTKPTASGLCISCHSVERTQTGLTFNWRAYDRTKDLRGFTKFSHKPHLLLSNLSDCTHCHAIDPAAATASYRGYDATPFASDFLPLSKRQCIECHTAKAAGNACQQCHNYHVESDSRLSLKRTHLNPQSARSLPAAAGNPQ